VTLREIANWLEGRGYHLDIGFLDAPPRNRCPHCCLLHRTTDASNVKVGTYNQALPIFLLALRDALVAGKGTALRRNVLHRFYAAYGDPHSPKSDRCERFYEALKTAIAAKIVRKQTNRWGKVTLQFTPKPECCFFISGYGKRSNGTPLCDA